MSLLNKKEFITRQFRKTHNKKFENYVLTRIWHGINSIYVKMVMQQYVIIKSRHALLDAYFPQLNLGIEVDEGQHKIEENITKDKIREKDIIRAIDCIIMRVDVTQDLKSIHKQCNNIIEYIKSKLNDPSFEPWIIENEFQPDKYISKGFIEINDNAVFRTMVDTLKCFGLNYKTVWTGETKHPFYEDTSIWFPRLYARGEWINDIDETETTIYEQNIDKQKNEDTLKKWLSTSRDKRIVFAYSKDSLGYVMYRFKGVFKLDKEITQQLQQATWRKISDSVKTFKLG